MPLGQRRVPLETYTRIITIFINDKDNSFESWWLRTPVDKEWYSAVTRWFITLHFPRLISASFSNSNMKAIIRNSPDLFERVACHKINHRLGALLLFARAFKGPCITHIQLNLSTEDDDFACNMLVLLTNIYNALHLKAPDSAQAALHLISRTCSQELLAAFHEAGRSGAREIHVRIVHNDDTLRLLGRTPSSWPGRFEHDEYPFTEVLALNNFGLGYPTMMSSLLKQQSVRKLIMKGNLPFWHWEFVLHALNMPELAFLQLEGSLPRHHFYECMIRHPEIQSLHFGAMSCWQPEKYPLHLANNTLRVSGPDDVIAKLVKDTGLVGIRTLHLKPSWTGGNYWDAYSIKRIVNLINDASSLKTLILDIDERSLCELQRIIVAFSLELSVAHLHIVQEYPLSLRDRHFVSCCYLTSGLLLISPRQPYAS